MTFLCCDQMLIREENYIFFFFNFLAFRSIIVVAPVLPAVIHGDFLFKNRESKGFNLPQWEILRLKKSSERNTCVDSNLTASAGTERHPTRSKDKPHPHMQTGSFMQD